MTPGDEITPSSKNHLSKLNKGKRKGRGRVYPSDKYYFLEEIDDKHIRFGYRPEGNGIKSKKDKWNEF